MRNCSALAVLFLLLSGASAAVAQYDGGPRMGGGPRGGPGGGPSEFRPHGMSSIVPPGRWWNNPDTIKALTLTADQRTKMDGIMNTKRLDLIDAVATVEKAEAVLDPLVGADKPDEQAILSQIDKVAEARASLEKTHARMLLAIRAQLTPDQWVKLQAQRPPMHGPGDRGPGGHGDRGGPKGPDGEHGEHGQQDGPPHDGPQQGQE